MPALQKKPLVVIFETQTPNHRLAGGNTFELILNNKFGIAEERSRRTFELWKRLPRIPAVDEPAGAQNRNNVALAA